MKLAVTDACIFIELYDLELNEGFFKLDLEIHTSVDVINELYAEQQRVLKAFQSVGKLFVHSISESDRLFMQAQPYPRGLSNADKTVLFIAEKQQAMVLSSDKMVRNFSKKNSIEYHGMLWIFDRLVEAGIISPGIAIKKLQSLMSSDIIYQHSPELQKEMRLRIEKWAIE
ncbi:hypothetical protein QWY86_05340 [Pedobacter aquatilis]|uniref:hypothetical protein n=1 Tax=Pedobacter aquatilis TaxID=351343 RepID=UPI0025B355C8|nr:hypothetical protein [Pedobacter aquatilis]MDN3586080.1 hypothetical protein [Pedobacter aquatilis]